MSMIINRFVNSFVFWAAWIIILVIMEIIQSIGSIVVLIKKKIKTKKVLVDDISKLKDKKISSFEIDRKLVEALNKINFVKSQYTELETDEDVIKLTYDIEDIDESLRAFKKFYNETIVFYNRLIRKFPYNIMGKILKYKEKTFFDGKDMNDDDIKDFKL